MKKIINQIERNKKIYLKFFILSFSLFVLSNFKIYSQNYDNASKGSSTSQFLRIPATPRLSAMGEALGAASKDSASIDINPACLIDVKKKSIVFSHTSNIAQTKLEYFSYSSNLGEDMGSWGIAVKYFDWGKLEMTDQSGAKIKDITPYDIAISISFASYISGFNSDEEERFVFGGTGKIIRTQIDKSASAVSADLGFLTPFMFDRKFRLSLSVNSLIGSLKFDKESSPLPTVIRLGSAIFMSKEFLITSDIIAPNDSFMYLTLGTEYKIKVARKTEIFLRAGVNTKNIVDYSGFKNITSGFALRYYEYNFDYSFTPYGELGNIHRISFSLNY